MTIWEPLCVHHCVAVDSVPALVLLLYRRRTTIAQEKNIELLLLISCLFPSLPARAPLLANETWHWTLVVLHGNLRAFMDPPPPEALVHGTCGVLHSQLQVTTYCNLMSLF